MASQFGPYKLIRQVAVGGMAEIHLAKTAGIAGFEKYVAIKMIHPNFAEDEQFIQMLVDEAKIAVQLNHGNIAQTFDLGRVGETYYITMEYVDGADLYKILRRASEQDLEMPLDVCAFVGKEISSALDHAHRKRDHTGKSLGIVHRDVSPQNVLVSYSGEVKLVDFGIAKATMKARQTAVGVIKGKYYYMSPEQAWGDPIDYRSDIFSAGIVLYEMITGQMLYLEEDLHKLLEMARAADIAPPSKLRKGVPPQLERIVMRALAKLPADRYQSAGDFATDLERFLHVYSPVFTAAKLTDLMRQVVGDPLEVPDDDEVPFQAIEFRDGVMSTHPLDDSEIAHAVDRDELRDENSVIFRMSDLDKRATDAGAKPAKPAAVAKPAPVPVAPVKPPAPPTRTPPIGSPIPPRNEARPTEPSKPIKQVAPRTTRATDTVPPPAKIPSIAPKATGGMKIPPIAKPPRQAHEETRQLEGPAPANPLHEDSGLLSPSQGKKLWPDADDGGDDLENIGERTMVTAAPGAAGSTAGPGGMLGGFMMDVVGDDTDGPVEATLVTSVPGFGGAPALAARDDAGDDDEPDLDDLADEVDDDMPTLSGREGIEAAREIARDLSRDAVAKQQRDAAPRQTQSGAQPGTRRPAKAPPPAALAAKIHAPAVSELRKPRASRRTPPGGMPVTSPNVLQAIVSSQGSAPMPSPRTPPPQPQPQPPAQPLPPPPASPVAAMHASPSQPHYVPQPPPSGQHDAYIAPYATDASGLPLGIPTPPAGVPVALTMPGQMYPGQMPGQMVPGQPYLVQPGMPPGGYDPQTAVANQVNAYGYPQLSPQALYQFQPPQQQKLSLTGQLRLSEVDEMPSVYKISSAGRRWFTYAVSGLIAVSVAAAATFVIIRSTRDSLPTTGTIHIDSSPQAAVVTIDGSKMTQTTPVTIDEIPVGTRHTIRIEAAHYQPYEETIDIPKKGGEVTVIGRLVTITGKILVDSHPLGAEIWINNTLRGRTPMTLTGLDLTTKVHMELRLKDYQPAVKDYDWPADGKITISETLVKVK